jgi:hypothetical protein
MFGLSPAEMSVVILVIAMVLYITEVIPLAATAVLSCILLIIFKVVPAATVWNGLSSDVNLLIAGMIVVGAGIFESGLAMRIGQKLSPKGRVSLIDTKAAAERFSQRGRGAISNQTGRYEKETRFAFDDGWDTIEQDAARIETLVMPETARTVITFNRSPDIPFDRTINPYRGCEHGCIYCFARPTHSWQGLSAGLDFESRLFYKTNALRQLEWELSRPGYVCRPIALGMNTDAFQPIERTHTLTRQILEMLAAHDHPVTVLTKSALIQRDIDLLAPMAAKGLVRAGVSITTLDRTLCRKMEPRAVR